MKYNKKEIDRIFENLHTELNYYSSSKSKISKIIEKFYLDGKSSFGYIRDVINNKEIGEKIKHEELIPFFLKSKSSTINSYVKQFVNIGYISLIDEKISLRESTYIINDKIPNTLKANNLFNKDKITLLKRSIKIKKFLDD